LNTGTRAQANNTFGGRGVDDTAATPNDSVLIEHTGGVAGNETILVTEQGRTQTFAHVHNIYAYLGDGNDMVVVKPGVFASLYAYGGAGDDNLQYFGTGSAYLDGGDGNDYLEVGSQAAGTVTMYGDAGVDYLVYDGSLNGAYLNGGADSDSL